VPVLACGASAGNVKVAISVTMRELLQRQGVPEAMIWTEEHSRSTHENALFGADILRKHGIAWFALIVEAQSICAPRRVFEKRGLR
jgi:uncharacterized SAM-binding protein YcdF (DUF218 family)